LFYAKADFACDCSTILAAIEKPTDRLTVTMANREFYYFFAPTWDYPPGGPIKLGNVITSIKKPERPLYTAPLPTDAEVFSTEQRRVDFSVEKLRAGQLSIFTRFLNVLGVSVDASVEREVRYVALGSFSMDLFILG
jgi:hypothetical protein